MFNPKSLKIEKKNHEFLDNWHTLFFFHYGTLFVMLGQGWLLSNYFFVKHFKTV